MWRISLILVPFLLCACGDAEKPEEPAAHKPPPLSLHADQKLSPGEAPALSGAITPSDGPEPDAQTLAKADEMLAYHNHIQAVLAKGSQADELMARTHIYLATWHLPKPVKTSRHNGLMPPEGLFSEADEKAITGALRDMDKALAEMAGHYASLDKYARDSSILDEGRQGKALGKKMAAAHTRYIKARKSWLEVVDKAARAAEEHLLHKHPLKRQIIAAREIFNQYREAGNLLASGGSQTALLEVCEGNIRRLLDLAAKPPFPAKPELERYYRAFLKQVQAYADILDRGIKEGFHSVQKRELNAAAEATRLVYNKFAEKVNNS